MSIHGTQLRLPFAINKLNQDKLSFEATFAANFATMLDRVQDEENLILYSQVTWPFLFIQAEPNHHLMIDDIGFCNFEERVNNAPRTAQAGHVIRDQNLKELEKLILIQKILKFEHKIHLDGKENQDSPEGEYIDRTIKGLVNSNISHGFSKILNRIESFQMSDFTALESLFTFDQALEFAQQYIDTINLTKGNRTRWDTIKQIINEPINKWLVDLKVRRKDEDSRYQSMSTKLLQIDENKIEDELDLAKDSADQWLLREQKNLILKIGKLFVGIDLIFEDLRKKNRFFTNTDSLRTHEVDEVLQKAFQHIAFLRENLNKSDEKLAEISIKMNEIKKEIEHKYLSADEKIDSKNAELLDKKYKQEMRLNQLKSEHENMIELIETEINNLSTLFGEIEEFIDTKIQKCQQDVLEIQSWQINDNICHIDKPTVRYFIPVTIGIIEDEDEDERIEIIFPGYIGANLQKEFLAPSIKQMEKDLSKFLDRDMKIRSNFEFAAQKGNLKKEITMQQAIKKGFNQLENLGLLSGDEKQDLEEKLAQFLK